MRRELLLLLFCCITCVTYSQHKTDWFKNAGYGIMVHYLNSLQNTKMPWNNNKITSWDSCVNAFDANKFAHDVNATGAKYVIFTVQSTDEYFCAPNITFERITGLKRGTATSHRDLINDLHKSLSAYNIDLMLYVTGNGPFKHFGAMESLTNNNFHNRVVNNAFQVSRPFVITWSKVLREFSVRYKDKVKGWWVDGAYAFIGYNDITLGILASGLKAGNKKAIVAFNPSPKETVSYYSNHDDYTAGEIYHINSKPKTRMLKKVQWHATTFLGADWGRSEVRFKGDELANYIKSCNKNGGVVTIDVFLNRDGSLNKQQIDALQKVEKRTGK
jgi:alpha-L-fucosidase